MIKSSWRWLGALLLVLSSGASAADFVVIANPSLGLTNVTVDELRSVYLRTSTSLKKCGHVEPIMQKLGAAHQAFANETLGMNASALWTYYRQQMFTGTGGMPRIVEGDENVVSYVKKTKNAVGYVSKEAAVEGVNVLKLAGD
ncbi:MAG TPA: hypothetical protein VLY24_24170 [Bryobacteraceae bacterium]|nr:hypothetical protein [Bryobacteraceae bacterium]